jgi:two-component system, NarL family, response regulator DevR
MAGSGVDARRKGGPQVSIRVVIASPDRGQRALVERQLADVVDMCIVANTDDVASTVLQATRVEVHVVVITPAFLDGLDGLCAQLRALESDPRTLLLDESGDEASLLHAIETGVDGYVTEGAGIGAAIEALARGESVIPPAMLGPLLRRLIERRREAAAAAEQLVKLTPREREVLALLVEGRDQNDISGSLFISPETTRTHIQRVMRKLGVHSRTEAVALVERTGLADRLERMADRSAS